MSIPDWKRKLEETDVQPADLQLAELKSALNAVTDEGEYQYYRRKQLIKQEAIERGLVEEGDLVDLT